MDNIEYNLVTLDNGVEYTEICRLDNDGMVYILLSNLDNPNDFCIKRVINNDGNEYIEGLKDKEEFQKLFKLFTDKMIN